MSGALRQSQARLLVIACGALAHEIVWLRQANGWQHIELQCLDAGLHNNPRLIVPKLRDKIERNRNRYDHIFVAYADCGTGGEIDRLLEEQGIERLPGAHCYAVYAGEQLFADMIEQELGTFYLTDFLAEHFQRLVVKGLKLDKYPDLHEQYFVHYKRLLYLSQRNDSSLIAKAQAAANWLKLDFVHKHCGYGGLHTSLGQQVLKLPQGAD